MGEGVSKALQGKRVVVTRAAEQSEQLVAELRARGAVPVMLPMVAFASPDSPELLDAAIRNLREYDWVFVTSQNALRAIRERCELLKIDLRGAFSGVEIAAVGPATAEALRDAGLRVAHVASKHQGTALAEELAAKVRGKKVLLPRSDRANPDLVESLKRIGAEVTEVCAYKTVGPESGARAAAEKAAAEADAVLFFSPSAVHHLEEALGKEAFVKLSRGSAFVANGPVTEGALRKAGVERVLLARDTSAGAVVESLTSYFVQEEAQAGMPVPRRR